MSNKFGVKEVADIIFYNLETGKPELFLETLKLSTLDNTVQSSDAKGGKGNPKLLTWDFNRESTMDLQDALMSPKSIAMLAGTQIQKGATPLRIREVLKVVAGKASLSEVLIPGSLFVYLNDNSDLENELTLGIPTNLDEYSITGKEITVDTGVTSLEVFYQYMSEATAETIVIKSSSFPGFYEVVGFTVVRNADTGIDEKFQITLGKVKLQGNFKFEMKSEGDPSVFDMKLTIYKPSSGEEMVRMTKSKN